MTFFLFGKYRCETHVYKQICLKITQSCNIILYKLSKIIKRYIFFGGSPFVVEVIRRILSFLHFLLFINPFPNKPWLLRVCSTSFLKTLWKKEKLLIMSNFSFSHSVFHPFGELSVIIIKFEVVVYKLIQFGRV